MGVELRGLAGKKVLITGAAKGQGFSHAKAFAEARYPPLSVAEAQSIKHPVLVVSGDNDKVLGRGPRLAGALGNALYLEVAGADHFSLAADETVKDAVGTFLVESER